MPAKKTSRVEIINAADRLFNKEGYHQTSINTIAKQCGIYKGSIFHYFDNKKHLMKEVLRENHRRFNDEVLSVAYEKEKRAYERMSLLFKKVNQHYLDPEDGCIMGNIGLETSNTVPEFKGEIRRFFGDWIEAFTEIYRSVYESERARKVASARVQELEGAIMLCRFFDDTTYIENTMNNILQELES